METIGIADKEYIMLFNFTVLDDSERNDHLCGRFFIVKKQIDYCFKLRFMIE